MSSGGRGTTDEEILNAYRFSGKGISDEEILAKHKFSGAGSFNTGGGSAQYKINQEFTTPKLGEYKYVVLGAGGSGEGGSVRDSEGVPNKMQFTGADYKPDEPWFYDADEKTKRFFKNKFKEMQKAALENFEYPDIRNTRIYYDLTKASDFALGLEVGGIKNISIIKVEDHWEVRYF